MGLTTAKKPCQTRESIIMPIRPQFPIGPRHDIIKAEAFCSICGQRFDLVHLQVLEEREGNTLLYIRCQQCQTGSVSSISFGQGRLNFVTMPTDLNENEVLRYTEDEMLGDDQVLEIHARLNSQDNFLDMF